MSRTVKIHVSDTQYKYLSLLGKQYHATISTIAKSAVLHRHWPKYIFYDTHDYQRLHKELSAINLSFENISNKLSQNDKQFFNALYQKDKTQVPYQIDTEDLRDEIRQGKLVLTDKHSVQLEHLMQLYANKLVPCLKNLSKPIYRLNKFIYRLIK